MTGSWRRTARTAWRHRLQESGSRREATNVTWEWWPGNAPGSTAVAPGPEGRAGCGERAGQVRAARTRRERRNQEGTGRAGKGPFPPLCGENSVRGRQRRERKPAGWNGQAVRGRRCGAGDRPEAKAETADAASPPRRTRDSQTHLHGERVCPDPTG